MGDPALDPNAALELIQAALFWITCILAGAALLGFSAYIVFLCSEIFSAQPHSKARVAKLPHAVGRAPVPEENLDLAAETPVPAEAESPGEEATGVPALLDESQRPVTLASVAMRSKPARLCGFLSFLRSRATVPEKPHSSLRANALSGTMREGFSSTRR